MELEAAAAWYDDRRPGLGFELVQAVRATVESILDAPERWPSVGAHAEHLFTASPMRSSIVKRQMAQ